MNNSVFQKYAAALLPFFVLTVGALGTVLKDPLNFTGDLTFALLVVGAIGTFGVKLLNSRWQGGAKTGIAIFTTILAAVVPFAVPGGFNPAVSVPVIVVAVLNALATEFGVYVRVTPPDVAPAPVTAAPPVVNPPTSAV